MAETLDPIILMALRLVQIGLTIIAIYAVWRHKPPMGGATALVLPALFVLLSLSVLGVSQTSRLAVGHDLIVWTWTVYDLIFPMAAIRLAGGVQGLGFIGLAPAPQTQNH